MIRAEETNINDEGGQSGLEGHIEIRIASFIKDYLEVDYVTCLKPAIEST